MWRKDGKPIRTSARQRVRVQSYTSVEETSDDSDEYECTKYDRSRGKCYNRGRWAKEEDAKLKHLVQAYGSSKWSVVAKCFNDRSEVQCRQRWLKVVNPNLVKGSWTKEEDDKVIELVNKYGPKKWTLIAKYLDGRIGKQCRERWHNHLNPEIKKTAWTLEEEKVIIDAHKMWGNQWSKISKLLAGRTDNAIKNHWNSTLKKRADCDVYRWIGKQKEKSRAYKKKKNRSDAPSCPNTEDTLRYDHLKDSVAASSLVIKSEVEDSAMGRTIKEEVLSDSYTNDYVPPIVGKKDCASKSANDTSDLSFLEDINVEDLNVSNMGSSASFGDLSVSELVGTEFSSVTTPVKFEQSPQQSHLCNAIEKILMTGKVEPKTENFPHLSPFPVKSEIPIILNRKKPPCKYIDNCSWIKTEQESIDSAYESHVKSATEYDLYNSNVQFQPMSQTTISDQIPNQYPVKFEPVSIKDEEETISVNDVDASFIDLGELPSFNNFVDCMYHETPSKGNTPIKSSVFSPSQFLNQPYTRCPSSTLTSTPKCNIRSPLSGMRNVQLEANEDSCSLHTPKMSPLNMSLQAFTPIKNIFAETFPVNELKQPNLDLGIQANPLPCMKRTDAARVQKALDFNFVNDKMDVDKENSLPAKGRRKSFHQTWSTPGDVSIMGLTKGEDINIETPSKLLFGEASILFSPPSIVRETFSELSSTFTPNKDIEQLDDFSIHLTKALTTPKKMMKLCGPFSKWSKVAFGKTNDQLELTELARKWVNSLHPRSLKL